MLGEANKHDLIDAENAARALLANPTLPHYTPSHDEVELKRLTRTRARLARQLQANRLALRQLDNSPAHELLLRLIRSLESELAALDALLAQAVATLRPELCELPGLGPCLASIILAEVGSIERFVSANHFASY